MVNQRGVTLIELVVALAIASFLFAGLGAFFLSALAFEDHATSQTDMQRQGGLALEEMARIVRRAHTVVIPCVTGMANSVRLVRSVAGGATEETCIWQGAESVAPLRANQILRGNPGGAQSNLLTGQRFPVRVSTVAGQLLTFSEAAEPGTTECPGVTACPLIGQLRITFTLVGEATVYPSSFRMVVKLRN